MKKQFIRKQVNKNFIFSFTLAAMLFFVVLLGVVSINSSIFDEENLFFYVFFGLGAIAWVMIWIFMIILPAMLAFYIFIFALIARLIYKETARRIRVYRILMGFSFSGQILLLLAVFSCVKSGEWLSLIALTISGYIFFAIYQGMRGTYTDRIKSIPVKQKQTENQKEERQSVTGTTAVMEEKAATGEKKEEENVRM